MTTTDAATRLAASTRAAAGVAGGLLPSPEALQAGDPVPVARSKELAMTPGAAVLARLRGGSTGEIAIVVGAELVEALASSPLGALDLVPAVQPALDALAEALGGQAEAGILVEPAVVLDPAGSGDTTVVPLVGDGQVRALVVVRATAPTTAPAVTGGRPRRSGLDLLHDVSMEVRVELGRTKMTVRDLLALSPGSLVELDRAAGSPADLFVHGTLIARGEIVVIDEEFGLRVTEIVTDEGNGP